MAKKQQPPTPTERANAIAVFVYQTLAATARQEKRHSGTEPEEFHGHVLRELVRRWLVLWVGERCPEKEPGCSCCQSWGAFDTLFHTLEE